MSLLRKIAQLLCGHQPELREYKRQLLEMEEAMIEYQEIIEAGWDYPDITLELPSPKGRIPKSNVSYNLSAKTLTIKDCPETIFPVLADTNSMEPWLDIQHLAFLVPMPQEQPPFRYEDLVVGDVAVYNSGHGLILHTIVKITEDTQGRFYTFRGNNTSRHDPYLVRNEHIQYLYYGGINVI